jgi:5S rRNA maturation endonuclease (ribonuclease M5)
MDTKDEILKLTERGLEVFNFYMPFAFRLKKNFLNPLYEDTKPSCQIFFSQEADCYMMYDFGNPAFSGDCFWFVAVKCGLDVKSDFVQVLNTIIKDLHLNISPIGIDSYSASSFATNSKKTNTKTPINDSPKMKPYHFHPIEFSEDDLLYWRHYGITEQILIKYGVLSLDEYQGTNSDGIPFSIHGTETEPMYAYTDESFVKIYRPKSKMRFLYGGLKPPVYCFGLKSLPSHGDIMFITGGEKDVLSLVSHGFNAVCFNSETATIPISVIDLLQHRFRHIIVMYDADETGISGMQKASDTLSEYNVLTLKLPLSGTKADKDISDYFAKGHTQLEFQSLVNNCLEPLFSQSLFLMKACEMDFKNPPDVSKNVISINGVPLGTYDNLLCVTGGEGTGKSNFVAALIAGTWLTEDLPHPIDTLGLTVTPNYTSKAVLHFDTEQSEYQLYKNVMKAKRRSNLSVIPDFYHSFYLTAMSRKERLQVIKDSLDLYNNRYGGIHLVVIDGIADLVHSANDEAESIAVVEELYRLAGIYQTCIICVLHFVPNGLKLRGHIGSELQRKAAAIISIEKDEDPSYSVIKALKVRDGSPLDVPMLMFKWNKEKGMFTSAGSKSEESSINRRKKELRKMATEIFLEIEKMSYSDMASALMESNGVSLSTAKNYIRYMINDGFIEKYDISNYRLKP